MEKIQYLRFYLSGPMDAVKDRGIEWRREFTKELVKAGAKRRNVVDPTDNPTKSKDLQEEYEAINRAKENRVLTRVHALSKKMIREDLRCVDVTDCFVLGLFSEDGEFPRCCGTLHEVILASTQHKPIYVITNIDWVKFPIWLIGLLPQENYYWEMDACVRAILRDIESNWDRRWVFLENLYGRED